MVSILLLLIKNDSYPFLKSKMISRINIHDLPGG